MSYGNDEIAYSDDQIGVGLISEFDTEPMPGLYDTTRADIFKMVSSPCLSCDAPFKGMPQQMQYGPPFRPPCESSMSYDYNVPAQVQARYPEDGVRCMSCGGPPVSRTPNVMINPPMNKEGRTWAEQKALEGFYCGPCRQKELYIKANQKAKNAAAAAQQRENYQTFGKCGCPNRPYVSAGPQGYGCSCLGLIGCRRLPEAPQSGVFPETFMPYSPLALGMMSTMNNQTIMFFLFIFIVIIYVAHLHNKLTELRAKSDASTPANPATSSPETVK